MSSLSAMFRSAPEQQSDNDKLLQLYWNRNELKKEFARLQKNQSRLQDKIKQQQSGFARLQQKLDYLEELLLGADSARNVLVHYQLRGTALRCRKKLEKFAEQLKQQREQKLRTKSMAEWSSQQADDVAVIEERIHENRCVLSDLAARLEAEKSQLLAAAGILKFLTRRRLRASLDSIAAQIEAGEQSDQLLQKELADVLAQTPPDNTGLDLATKRSINFMILAFAQQLYVQFGDDQLVGLVREATEKSVGAVNYGTEYECEQLLRRIRASSVALDKATDHADILQKRAKLIGERAMFEADDIAVPVTGSVSSLIRIDANGAVRTSDLDLLGSNLWGIGDVLSR